MKESIQYHIFKQIQDNPEITQRELASKAGVSVGKANYCLKALMDKGLIKAINFKNSRSKAAYLYKLTPQGIEEKAKLTVRFLKYKMAEYDRIKAEIEELRTECDDLAVKNEEFLSANLHE